MGPVRLVLQPSEGMVFRAAATIYSAYVSAGRVQEGKEKDWHARAITEAIAMAQMVDAAVQSDEELS